MMCRMSFFCLTFVMQLPDAVLISYAVLLLLSFFPQKQKIPDAEDAENIMNNEILYEDCIIVKLTCCCQNCVSADSSEWMKDFFFFMGFMPGIPVRKGSQYS